MKRWLASRAPVLQRLLHLLDGRAVDAIRSDVRALGRAMHERGRDGACFERAIAAADDASRAPELAWLGPAPYQDTGIGRFSWECVKAAPAPTDYFAPATRPGPFLASGAELAEGSPHRLLDMEALAYAALRRRYRAAIISVGNSRHNLPTVRAADDLEAGPAQTPLWWHVHDLQLLNLVWLLSGEEPRAFAARLRAAYGEAAITAPALSPIHFPELLASGVLGARALLRGRRVDRVIVNSRFAAELAARELEGVVPPDRIVAAFHPVFPLAAAHAPPARGLRIGTFGAPGPSKQTELVIEACAALRRQGTDATLVLAGYGVDRWASERRALLPGWVEAYDTPSRARLEELMAGVSVAVQLRREGLGESSGVAADLAAIGVPVVVSDVGALSELTTAAAKVSPTVSAEELAAAAAAAARTPPAAESVHDLSPAAFWRLIESRLDAPARPASLQLARSVP